MNIEICTNKKLCGRAFGSKLIIKKLLSTGQVIAYWDYSLKLKSRCLFCHTCRSPFIKDYTKALADNYCIIVTKAIDDNYCINIFKKKEEMKKMEGAFEVPRDCPFYTEHTIYDINKQSEDDKEKDGC